MNSGAVRPRMASRAVSDLQPLVTPPPSNNDLGRGTHAISGGAKVTSGARTALGGIAPMSPFLPLPPAPKSNELMSTHDCANTPTAPTGRPSFLSVQNSNGAHLRSTSNTEVDGESCKKMARGSSAAAHMIRSYSLPVATLRDYQAQQEAMTRRQAWHAGHHGANAESLASSHYSSMEGPRQSQGMTASMSLAGGGMNAKHLLQTEQAASISRKTNKISPRLQPRSPLSVIVVNESSLPQETNDMDLGSGSEEADIATPRATSPMYDYFSKPDESLSDIFQSIHPDHLAPPPALTL